MVLRDEVGGHAPVLDELVLGEAQRLEVLGVEGAALLVQPHLHVEVGAGPVLGSPLALAEGGAQGGDGVHVVVPAVADLGRGDAVLGEPVGAVDHAGGVGGDRDRDELVVQPPRVQQGRVPEGGGVDQVVEGQQHAVLGELAQARVVHLEHVGQIAGGHAAGQALPQLRVAVEVRLDLDALVLLLEQLGGLLGEVGADVVAPPFEADGDRVVGGPGGAVVPAGGRGAHRGGGRGARQDASAADRIAVHRWCSPSCRGVPLARAVTSSGRGPPFKSF